MCVCLRVGVRVFMHVCMRACVRASVYVCTVCVFSVCVCVRAFVRVYVSVYVCCGGCVCPKHNIKNDVSTLIFLVRIGNQLNVLLQISRQNLINKDGNGILLYPCE